MMTKQFKNMILDMLKSKKLEATQLNTWKCVKAIKDDEKLKAVYDKLDSSQVIKTVNSIIKKHK